MIRIAVIVVIGFVFALLSSSFVLQNQRLVMKNHAMMEELSEMKAYLRHSAQTIDQLYDAIHDLYSQLDEINDVMIFYREKENISLTKRERDCLARNVYFEAGVEDHVGKIAVAQITLNRLQSGRWGNNVCSVVYAPSQFSWTLLSNKRNKTPRGPLWKKTQLAVDDFLSGARVSGLENSMFYFADYISKPRWARSMTEVAHIGRHRFFEEAS